MTLNSIGAKPGGPPGKGDEEFSEWMRVHREALVIDTHADTAQRFLDEGWRFPGTLGRGMLNLATARAGGLGAEFFAIWVDPAEYPVGTHARRALALTQSVLDEVRRNSEDLQLCRTAADLREAHAAGRFGVLLGLEGGHAIENDLGRLREFYALGVRYMTLTWSFANDWADSCGDAPRHGGLTELGQEVVREMNRLGMMVDVSHVSDATFADVLEVSRAPVIASHSSSRALTGAKRNLTDDQLRALAAAGGVAMVNFFPAFIDEDWRLAWNACRKERQTRHDEAAADYRAAGRPVPFAVSDSVDRMSAERIGRAPFASLIDHFDHMLQVAGVEHVGIGSDFDGIPALPGEIDSAADLPKVTKALMARGYTAGDLRMVLGGNVLRVMEEVQSIAQGPDMTRGTVQR